MTTSTRPENTERAENPENIPDGHEVTDSPLIDFMKDMFKKAPAETEFSLPTEPPERYRKKMILTLMNLYEHLGPGVRLYVTESSDDLTFQFCEASYYLGDHAKYDPQVVEVIRADRDAIYIRVKKG